MPPLDPHKLDEYDERILGLLDRWALHRRVSHGAEAVPVLQTNAEPVAVADVKDFTPGARQVILDAQRSADRHKHREVSDLHLLEQLLALDAIQQALTAVGADPSGAIAALHTELATLSTGPGPAFLNHALVSLFSELRLEAAGAEITLLQLLRACVRPIPVATLKDLDRGLNSDRSRAPRARVIAAGRLDLLWGPN